MRLVGLRLLPPEFGVLVDPNQVEFKLVAWLESGRDFAEQIGQGGCHAIAW